MAPGGADLMSDCRICGDQLEEGQVVVRLDVKRLVKDTPGESYWGSPIGNDLRPVDEYGKRQHVHLDCLGGSDV